MNEENTRGALASQNLPLRYAYGRGFPHRTPFVVVRVIQRLSLVVNTT
jgi:hypothetical protein